MKLKKIDRVDISLKQLIDVDSSTGITRCVDCIGNGMILMASVSKNVSVRDSFIFKNLSDIVKGTNGVLTSVTNGILTLSIDPNAISAETSLSELSDVAIAGLADNDYLVYNSVSKKWENSQASFVPTTRTITINGVIQDLSANRTWTISSGSGTVTSVTGTGTVSGLTLSGNVTTSGSLTLGGSLTLTSGNVTTALGFTPISQATADGLYYPLSSNPSNYVTSSSLSSTLSSYLTIASATSTYQPIFTTQNGLTYGSGFLKLGGQLTQNTTIDGKEGLYSLSLIEMSQLTLQASDLNNTTEINLTTTQMQIKTPLYSSASVGDVLTLLDPATGEVEFQAPTGGSGGGDMSKSTYDTDNDGIVDKAETVQIIVRNSTGSTLTKGQVVYLSGATGNRPNAILADASTEATSSKTIGLVVANIANNTDGQVAVNGTLHDLDTSAFSDGDTLWLSETAGTYQANTPPAEPAHSVFIGYVARAHSTQGRIVLAIQNGYELNELHGVLVPSPSNNDVLYYDGSTSLWKNKALSKSDVGLGNVDNTSDANKPISTATQTALNAKQDTLVSGTNIKTVNSTTLLGSGNIAVEPTITQTTSADYYRGDKTFQPHNIASITDATDVGKNLVKLTNPSAIRYLRINADNTVDAITSGTLISDLGIATTLVLAKDNSIYSHTGNTTNTLVWSQSIAPNTFVTNDLIEWIMQLNTNTPNGTNVSYRIYINTSSSLTGATLLGTLSNSVGTGNAGFQRNIFVTATGSSGNLRVFPTASSASLSYTGGSLNASNITVDTTVTQYFIVAIQNGNTTATTSVQGNMIRLTR